MPDPYTPVDMAAIDLILAEYLRADVAARVSIRIAEALDAGALSAMARSIVHRGPDDEGVWHQPQRGVAVGNRRLSIIDLAGGHQPFVSDDGKIAVVQNGEIFNHVELAAELRAQGVRLDTHSDTEVIVHLYEEQGEAGMARAVLDAAVTDGDNRIERVSEVVTSIEADLRRFIA